MENKFVKSVLRKERRIYTFPWKIQWKKLVEQTADVVPESQYHQQHQQDHTYYLCHFQELIAWLAPCQHLVKAEDYMAAVQSRDRKQIHNAEHD